MADVASGARRAVWGEGHGVAAVWGAACRGAAAWLCAVRGGAMGWWALVVGLAAISAAMSAGCGPTGESGPGKGGGGGALRVVVSIQPLLGLAKELAPAGSEVTAIIGVGRSEHGHELTPAEAERIARADVVVYVGLGLEPGIARLVEQRPVKGRRVVCFASVVGVEDEHEGHSHGPEEACDHAVDPHLWLDPSLVERLVEAMRVAIEGAMGERGALTQPEREALSSRAMALAARVRALDEEIKGELERLKGRTIVTHHNAWSRLAERYGLKVAAVIREVEGAEPTPGAIERAVVATREHGARAVFVEPQYSAAAGERIAKAAGVRLERLDPLGSGDWFAMMRGNAAALVRGLK
ncbi:MAG: zinc ABC transporter substrate-binding protein [Phycisphaerae bacterium]|nr:zinc ABC transporter substrate-binding protein [Phycisphaerae bacterium]